MAKTNDNPHKNHRNRLRTRYQKYGLASFEEHNILELLLFHSIPRADTNGIAHELINTFGSLYDVLCAPYEELLRVKGVGPASAALIRNVSDTAREANLRKMTATPITDYPRLVLYATEWFIGKQAGSVAVIFFDDKDRIVHTEALSESHSIRAVSYAQSLEELADKHNARRIVLMHNHANGIMQPSDEDLFLTQQLYTLLQEKKITLLEHLVIHKFDCLPILDRAIHKRVSGFPTVLDDKEAMQLIE